MSTRVKVYILIALIVISIAITTYVLITKGIKNRNAEEIKKAIDNHVGEQGIDLDGLLYSTTADSSAASIADLEKLKAASGGMFGLDKPDNFKDVFLGKSKKKLKRLLVDFQSKYGIKLNDYVNTVFDDLTGYDTDRYNQLLDIVRNAS